MRSGQDHPYRSSGGALHDACQCWPFSCLHYPPPAFAEGNVAPTSTYWGGWVSGSFNCNNMASLGALQDCEKARRQKWLDDDRAQYIGRGASNVVSCAPPALDDLGPAVAGGISYIDHFTLTYYRIAYTCGGFGWQCNIVTFCQKQPVSHFYISTRPACPANSSGTPPACTCSDTYVPDAGGTSCIPEPLTIALHGFEGQVMPGRTLDAAYAEVIKADGTGKSGEQVVWIYSVTPENNAPLRAEHMGTLSPNGGGYTGADGRLNIAFTAPLAGGTHILSAGCVNCTNTVSGSVTVPGCSVDDLPPIIDPEVQLFEDNPNRSDTTHLTPRMQTALTCLLRDAAAGSPTVGSAYRPPAYNQHLIDVWNKWDELVDNVEPACAALRTKIQGHFQRHGLLESQSPVPNSRHTRGEAVDVTINLPSATIDTVAAGCQLRRPLPVSDRVHFNHQ